MSGIIVDSCDIGEKQKYENVCHNEAYKSNE